MTTFAILYTPDWTNCTSSRCDVNATRTWRTEGQEYPSWLWLLWPSLILLYNGCMYCRSSLSHLRYFLSLLRLKPSHDYQHPTPTESTSITVPTRRTRLLLDTIDRLPACGYPVALFIWFHAYRSWEGDPIYYRVTSVVFLLGWITTFMLFCGITKHIYIFSMVLKDIIIKDIINSFMAVFIFTVIAFSSALYVLRGPVDNITVHDTFEINVYEVFASGLTMAEYIVYTIDEHGKRRFFRLDTRSSPKIILACLR